MKLPFNKSSHKTINEIKAYLSLHYSFLSLGEILPLSKKSFNIDLVNGIYSSKLYNEIAIYLIYKIEYQDYNAILYEGLHYRTKSISLLDNKQFESFNSFYYEESNLDIEIVPYNYELYTSLPIRLYQSHFGNNDNNKGIIREIYKDETKRIKNIFTNSNKENIYIIVGDSQNGITALIRRYSDYYGYYIFIKDFSCFFSYGDLLNYVKKREYSYPCIIIFRIRDNSNIYKILNDEIIKDISIVLNMKRNRDKNNIYLFYFKSISIIPNNLLKYTNSQIIKFHSLKVEDKLNIINNLSNKITSNIQIYFNQSKELANLLSTKIALIDNKLLFIDKTSNNNDITQICKVLLNLNLKDIKHLIKLSYINLLNELPNTKTINTSFIDEMKRIYNNKQSSSSKEDIFLLSSIPQVKWDDIGGMDNIKKEIENIITLPSKYPQLFSNITLRKRSGLLLYGPPGTGKTLIAKAIATESQMNFISIKGPELLNMYVGESEKNIMHIFLKARANSPCVLFFDEIDSLCPSKSKNYDQNNIMDRIVSQFMIEIDEIDYQKENVIIIASTNRPDLIEPSLLRPGRFDRSIYVDIPRGVEEKEKIINVYMRKMKLDVNVNLKEICKLFPKEYSGADIYKVCSKAFVIALKRFINNKGKDMKEVVIMKEDIEDSIKRTNPSIGKEDLDKFSYYYLDKNNNII